MGALLVGLLIDIIQPIIWKWRVSRLNKKVLKAMYKKIMKQIKKGEM